jgi:PAS domain S-box-containing protein
MKSQNSPNSMDQVFFRCVEDCYEPIMLTDHRGRLTYVNPAWVLTYGYSKQEALGETPRLLRSEYQDKDFYSKMWQTILDPNVGFWRGEVLNRAKDGHLVPVMLTITPYREPSGDISGYMGIAVDLTEQKKMEHQLLRQDRLASIGLLAGGLAHEIGNPLGVIRGRTELVQNAIKGNEFAEKNLEMVMAQIDRISGLIQSLLKVGRVPEKIMLREISLESAVNDVFTLMNEACRKSNVELRKKNIEALVLAEPSHLEQLLLNLMLNALHAIEEKKQRLLSQESHFIEIRAAEDQDDIVISLEDSGCGISPENLKKIFQPFYTTKSAGKGTGLGLAIVLKLTEEMRGKISIESPGEGKGATVTLRLQRASSKDLRPTSNL